METEPNQAESGGIVASETVTVSQSNSATPLAAGQDSRLADIIARQSAGEKLSASDRGYLGAQRRKANRPQAVPVAGPAPSPQAAAPADNQLFDQPPQAAPLADSQEPRNFDSGAIRRCAENILTGVDKITQTTFANKVKRLGASESTVAKWRDAVAMGEAKPMMVEGSEPVVIWLCDIFGCQPDQLESKLRGSSFLTGSVIWLLGIKSAAADLKQLERERKQQPEASQS
jgi:hypothetical protein